MLLLVALAVPAAAQNTLVTATVKDPDQIPLVNANVKAQLVNTNGTPVSGQPTVTITSQAQCRAGNFGNAPCQVPFSGTVGPVLMDTTGSFALALQDNALITPANTQWLFTIQVTPGIFPPLGVAAVTVASQITITGTTQSVSAQLTAATPLLTTIPLGGGGIGCTLGGTVDSSVIFNLMGACAGVSNFTTTSGGLVDINGGGNLEIDDAVDPSNNTFLFTGTHIFESGNGASGSGGLGGIQLDISDEAFPPDAVSKTITNVSLTNNLVTITAANCNATLNAGRYAFLTGLTTATFLNDQIIQIVSASATQCVGTFTHANYGSAADTGTIARQQTPGVVPYFADPFTAIPGGDVIGAELDIDSHVDSPFTANTLIGIFLGHGLGIPQHKSEYAYAADVSDMTGPTYESAGVRIEPQVDLSSHHAYALKIETRATDRDAAAVSAYSAGNVFAALGYGVKASETVGAAMHTVGTGLWDATSGSVALDSDLSAVYTLKICSAGTTDTWDWTNSGATPACQGSHLLPMTGIAQTMERGITVTWAATTGHTAGDQGTITVTVTIPQLYAGTGSPEGVVTADIGSIYMNNSGGAGVTLYVKQSGTGNTGWVAGGPTSPCTSTALSLQYNNAGALGCTPLTYTAGSTTLASNAITLDFSAGTLLKVPVVSSFTCAAEGCVGFDTGPGKTYHLFNNGVDAIAAAFPTSGFAGLNNNDCLKAVKTGTNFAIASAGAGCNTGTGITGGTAGIIPLYSGGTTINGSSTCDYAITTAATITCTAAGGITAPLFTATSSGAGAIKLGNGSAPSLLANGFSFFAPVTITTGFGWSAPTAENGSAGLLHLGAAASHVSALTISAVVGADMANNTVTSTQLAVVNTRGACDIPVGDTTGSAITNGQLGPQSRICYMPAAATIVEMDVNADAGTPNVIVGKNHAGSITNIVSSALATAAAGGIACSNTGGTTGINGATTCSATLQNTSLAAGDYLELVSGTAGGTAKFFVVHVIYTIN